MVWCVVLYGMVSCDVWYIMVCHGVWYGIWYGVWYGVWYGLVKYDIVDG